MASVYETITDRIISQLEAGRIPWRKEWKDRGRGNEAGIPFNLVSGKAYRGINVVSLLCSPYTSNAWCTYKQAQSLGYQVRKGEKASPVIYWQFPIRPKAGQASPDPASKYSVPFAKNYSVFNIEQLDGVPASLPLDDAGEGFDAIAEAETIVNRFMTSADHPKLFHGGDRAYFRPITDTVQMPEKTSFLSPAGYYATLFHEFAHSTGVESRLNRDELISYAAFGDENYSKEELTAEFASAFLCAEAGISNEERVNNSVAYIQSWIKELRHDKTLAVQAAQRAQKAADFIMVRQAAAVESEAIA